MNRFRKDKNQISHIELTPLIDMVFILLIFFMLSSSFIKPVINLHLPVAETSEKPLKENTLNIIIDNNKNIFINKSKIPCKDLSDFIKTQAMHNKDSKGVIFTSDKNVDYGFFIQIMDILKQNNIQEIALEHDSSKS
ncbi:ExbD/TolR family protein [bacterium]